MHYTTLDYTTLHCTALYCTLCIAYFCMFVCQDCNALQSAELSHLCFHVWSWCRRTRAEGKILHGRWHQHNYALENLWIFTTLIYNTKTLVRFFVNCKVALAYPGYYSLKCGQRFISCIFFVFNLFTCLHYNQYHSILSPLWKRELRSIGSNFVWLNDQYYKVAPNFCHLSVVIM